MTRAMAREVLDVATDDEIQPLADAIYRDRVLRARRTPGAAKLMDGPRLFDFACGVSMAGIRHQFPDADEARVRQILRDRLALAARLESLE